MIAYKPEERLYLTSWSYNAARIMSALAVIVENNGGRVRYDYAAIISNRSLSHYIREREERLERIKAKEAEADARVLPALAHAVKTFEQELEELSRIDNAPVRVTHTSYIRFLLDDTYYYYQIDDNPFFDFRIIKTPVVDGRYSQDAGSEEDKKTWWYDDCFLSFRCSGDDIKEAANLIFNMLITAPFSKIIRNGRRERVPNRYDGGYHYETIYTPERVGKIDF